MIKGLLQTFFGLILILLGIYTVYLYLQSLNTNPNPLFLVIMVVLMAAGLFFLVLATKSNNVSKAAKNESSDIAAEEALKRTLERNNEIVSEWKNTNTKRDKLKLLSIGDESSK